MPTVLVRSPLGGRPVLRRWNLGEGENERLLWSERKVKGLTVTRPTVTGARDSFAEEPNILYKPRGRVGSSDLSIPLANEPLDRHGTPSTTLIIY
jgi:hypothetical protein